MANGDEESMRRTNKYVRAMWRDDARRTSTSARNKSGDGEQQTSMKPFGFLPFSFPFWVCELDYFNLLGDFYLLASTKMGTVRSTKLATKPSQQTKRKGFLDE